MSRLTKKHHDNITNIVDTFSIKSIDWCDSTMRDWESAYTGEPIDKLSEYEDLEEEGKLIKLPCKVGDIVYEANISRNIVSSYRVTSIILMSKSRNYNWGLISGIYSNMNGFNEFALGRTIFLTREEAEKALKESIS